MLLSIPRDMHVAVAGCTRLRGFIRSQLLTVIFRSSTNSFCQLIKGRDVVISTSLIMEFSVFLFLSVLVQLVLRLCYWLRTEFKWRYLTGS